MPFGLPFCGMYRSVVGTAFSEDASAPTSIPEVSADLNGVTF